MNFFSQLLRDHHDLATPWRFSLSEWKDKVNNSDVGSPIHGLRAGAEAVKLGSAYRLKQGVNRINEGQNPFSSEFIKGMAGDQVENVRDFAGQNWPVLAVFGYGAYGGGPAAGGAGGGGGYGAYANAGSGLLSQSNQQPQGNAPTVVNNQRDDGAASRARMLQEMQMQALRQKPNKTIEEWQQLQQLTKNQGLLGYG